MFSFVFTNIYHQSSFQKSDKKEKKIMSVLIEPLDANQSSH